MWPGHAVPKELVLLGLSNGNWFTNGSLGKDNWFIIFKGFSPTALVTNAILASTNPTYLCTFSLLVACTCFFRLWTHKWWNWFLTEEQDGDVGMVESHVRQISHCQRRCFLHPRQSPPQRAAVADSSSHPSGGGESWIYGADCHTGHQAPQEMGEQTWRQDWYLGLLLIYHFLPDFFFPKKSITCCAHKANMTNLNSCWFLWTLQVPQREVGLLRSTEESRLPRAEEWQKCPHVFCLWHCHWWESFDHTARPVRATFTPVLKMFLLSLTFCSLVRFSLPSSSVT